MSALPLIVFDVNETLLDLQTMDLMLAYTQDIKISETDKQELKEKFSTMPPHREVPAALRKLRDAGFRLFTLTNNLAEVQIRQLEHGGIVDLFERRFSADGVKHHKPSRQAYAYVERELGVSPSQLCLIACHTWDTLGAVAAGWEAALIKRVGNDVLGVGPQPQIVGDDLNDVADQLIARQRDAANQPGTALGGAPARRGGAGTHADTACERSRPMSDLDHIGRRPVLAGIGAAALVGLLRPYTRVRAQALDRPPSVLVFDVAESLLDLQVLAASVPTRVW